MTWAEYIQGQAPDWPIGEDVVRRVVREKVRAALEEVARP